MSCCERFSDPIILRRRTILEQVPAARCSRMVTLARTQTTHIHFHTQRSNPRLLASCATTARVPVPVFAPEHPSSRTAEIDGLPPSHFALGQGARGPPSGCRPSRSPRRPIVADCTGVVLFESKHLGPTLTRLGPTECGAISVVSRPSVTKLMAGSRIARLKFALRLSLRVCSTTGVGPAGF